MGRSAGWALLWLACAGCSSEPETKAPGPPKGPCLPPSRMIGAACLEPGVQDNGCPAGTLGLDDGSCQPAGIPPELCAEGFTHDGDAVCEPVLPADPCPKGQMAVPGEQSCHPVMACGAGRWGDIPVDGASVYVDASYKGGQNDGSTARPWVTIGDAVAAAADGALIAVAAGKYAEDVVVNKRVRLFGVCPEAVEVAGTALELAALALQPGSSGSEVHGIAFSGARVGVFVSGAHDLVIEDVWIHDALGRGLDIEDSSGPASLTLRTSLVEANHDDGVFAAGVDLRLEEVVVRGTLPRASDKGGGRGIGIQDDPGTRTPSTVVLERAVVEDNREFGMFVASSQVTLGGVVVRRTLPRATDQAFGRGIEVGLDPGSRTPSVAVLKGSLVEDNRDVGVLIGGSEATLEGVVVRRTQPQGSDQQSGWGVVVQADANVGVPAKAHVRSSVVEDNYAIGVAVSGSEATLEGVVVRRTLPQASDQTFGRGVSIQLSKVTGARATASIVGSLVEDNQECGVLVSGSDATLEGVAVLRTLPQASDQLFGLGISIDSHPSVFAPSTAIVKGSRVEASQYIGVLVNGSQATLDALVVKGTMPTAADGFFGDGVAVASALDKSSNPIHGSAVVTRSLIEQSARAGLASFGADVELEGSALHCNAFDLNGEEFAGSPYAFKDLGATGRGCPEATGLCAAISSGLAPPEAPTAGP